MKKMLLLMVTFLLAATSINAAEKVFQNGVDGYDGCTDTYLTEEGKDGDKNHGSESLINLRGGS